MTDLLNDFNAYWLMAPTSVIVWDFSTIGHNVNAHCCAKPRHWVSMLNWHDRDSASRKAVI